VDRRAAADGPGGFSVEDRASLLARVARYELPLEDTLVMLRAYGWDADAELYQLSRRDVRSILVRYLESRLTAAQLQDWAELLEMRDDLGYEPQCADILKHILSRLANPEVEGAITRELVVTLDALLDVSPD
jgi:hypothetical protein